jgi:unsaturated rhamnogalacturonyl hydrolase
MKRRTILAGIPLAGFAAGYPAGLVRSLLGSSQKENESGEAGMIEKVRTAMLSMQRATWEQGVAMQAMLESGQPDLVILMAKDAVLRQSEDGRLAMLGEEFALSDAACPGEAVLWAAKRTGDPVLMNGFEKMVDYVMNKAPRTKEGIIYHFTNIPQVWSDINYMLPPFLAVAGECHEAMKQIKGVRGMLWNNDKKMLSHMWDCEKNEFARRDFWGVGNGWTAAGLARVIRAMPDSMKSEKEYLAEYHKELLDGCLKYMRPDGLFHNVVDNPGSFVETNLSQMLAYSIYRGVKGGWLEKSHLEKADKMRAAASGKVDELGLVQGVCGSPEFDHPGTATEGQAFFIMMETARREL